jgi:hypothetical protein
LDTLAKHQSKPEGNDEKQNKWLCLESKPDVQSLILTQLSLPILTVVMLHCCNLRDSYEADEYKYRNKIRNTQNRSQNKTRRPENGSTLALTSQKNGMAE